MRVLFIGDIMGNPGMQAVTEGLAELEEKDNHLDFIIANVENAAAGFGINKDAWTKLSRFDFDCMTSGNHIWDRPEVNKYINSESRLLRPANYPVGNPGFGWQVYEAKNKLKVAVINLQGRVYMQNIDCPFHTADKILDELSDDCNIIIVDFHADASSEKQAMGWYLDGRVSAVIGTHTHVQTADTRILPGGCGVIADVGMCGAYDSVIGMQIENALFRFLKGRTNRLELATHNLKFAAVMIDIDEADGKCKTIERLLIDVPSIDDLKS